MPYDDYMVKYNFHSLHNSYTSLVFFFGAGTLIVIYMVTYSAFRNWNKNHIMLAFCVLSIGVRSATDAIILSGNSLTFPFIIAAFILTYHNEKKRKQALKRNAFSNI